MEIIISSLGHSEYTPTKWRMTSSPHRKLGSNDSFRLIVFPCEIPKLDCFVERACKNGRTLCSIPIDTINLRCVCFDGFEGVSAFAIVPNSKELVVRGGNDVFILTIPFHLSCT